MEDEQPIKDARSATLHHGVARRLNHGRPNKDFKRREIETEETTKKKKKKRNEAARRRSFYYYLFALFIITMMMMVVCRTNRGNMRHHPIAAQNAIVRRPLMYKIGGIGLDDGAIGIWIIFPGLSSGWGRISAVISSGVV